MKINNLYKKYVCGIDTSIGAGEVIIQASDDLSTEEEIVDEVKKDYIEVTDIVACYTCGAIVEKGNAESIIISDESKSFGDYTILSHMFSFGGRVIKGNKIKSEDDDYRYYCKVHKPKNIDRIVNGKEMKFSKLKKKK